MKYALKMNPQFLPDCTFRVDDIVKRFLFSSGHLKDGYVGHWYLYGIVFGHGCLKFKDGELGHRN